MGRFRILVMIAATLALVAGLALALAHEVQPALHRVVIAVPLQSLSAPFYAAQELGLFAREGLAVEFREPLTGSVAMEDLLAGRVSFAVAADTPIVSNAIAGRPVRLLATIGENPSNSMVLARRDLGIGAVADLAGRPVGMCPGTSSEFFLDCLLAINGMARGSVSRVLLAPADVVPALASGRVVAVSTWAPIDLAIADELPGRTVTLDGKGTYVFTWNLVARRDDLSTRSFEVPLLRALAAAQVAIEEQPDRFLAVTARRLGTPVAGLEASWNSQQLDLVLDQSLVRNLEAQVRWQRANDTPGADDLRIADLVDPGPLRQVDRGMVTLFPVSIP